MILITFGNPCRFTKEKEEEEEEEGKKIKKSLP